MAVELQDLVDDLAATVGRPVALEDRRWRLLAFSAHTELEDRVRQASILARAAPPDVVAWLDTLGLERAGDIVDTPANPAIGMGPRTCAPVRHDGVLLGFLWVIPAASRSTPASARLVATAGEAATALWAQRAGGGEAHAASRRCSPSCSTTRMRRSALARPSSWPRARAGRAARPSRSR